MFRVRNRRVAGSPTTRYQVRDHRLCLSYNRDIGTPVYVHSKGDGILGSSHRSAHRLNGNAQFGPLSENSQIRCYCIVENIHCFTFTVNTNFLQRLPII